MSSTVVDDPAFERLYRRYVRDVYRFALALVRNPAEAEDVTQTTFLNAYRALQAGEEPRRPHSWLLTIAHNAARSRGRRAMRRPREVPLDDVVGQLAVPEHERTNVRELLRALGRLPFNQRAAITMRELEGRSYPEIAETLGVTVPAVEALLARARRALRLQAAAIRGLAVVGLPRSLRRAFDNGEAATGGVAGAGAVAKVVAVLAAGAVVGGVGLSSSVGSGSASKPQLPTRAQELFAMQQTTHAVVRAHRAARPSVGVAARVRARKSPAHVSHLFLPKHDVDPVDLPGSASVGARASVTATPGAPAPAATAPERPGPVKRAAKATARTTRKLPVAVPAERPNPPEVHVPTVQLPAVPAPPPLPPVQAPPVQAPPVQASPVQVPPVPAPTVVQPPSLP